MIYQLTKKPITLNGGRPRQLGSFIWDSKKGYYGFFVGYGPDDLQMVLSMDDFSALGKIQNADYKVDVKVRKKTLTNIFNMV